MPEFNSGSDAQLLRPSEVADQLGISGATLRRWSSRFSTFLDLADGGQESGSHRRYSAADVGTLASIKRLLEQGWTYEQVAEQLTHSGQQAGADPLDDRQTLYALADLDDVSEAPDLAVDGTEHGAGQLLPVENLTPAARFLRDAVQNLTDSQQIILNSQQASRDLMGVMIQDNLNLKSDASSLRERILELERELAEQRRRQADYRERMETRVRVLEDAVARLMAAQVQPVPPPPTRPPMTYPYQPEAHQPQQQPERRSFWSRLIGG